MHNLLNPDDRALIMCDPSPTEECARVSEMDSIPTKHPGGVVHIVTPTLHIKLPPPEFVDNDDQNQVCFNGQTSSSAHVPGPENCSVVDQNEVLTLLLLAEKFALDILHPCDEVSSGQLIAEEKINSLRGRVERVINDEKTRQTLMLLLLADEFANCDEGVEKAPCKDEASETFGDVSENVQTTGTSAVADDFNEEKLRESLLLLLLADQLSSDLGQCKNGEARANDEIEAGNQQSCEVGGLGEEIAKPKQKEPPADATLDDVVEEMADEDFDDEFYAALLLLMLAENSTRMQSQEIQKNTSAVANCGVRPESNTNSTTKTAPVSTGVSKENEECISNGDLMKYMHQLRELLASNAKRNSDKKSKEQITKKVDTCTINTTAVTGGSGLTRFTGDSDGDSSECLGSSPQKLSPDWLALLNACNDASFEDCMNLFLSFLDKQQFPTLNSFSEPCVSTTCA